MLRGLKGSNRKGGGPWEGCLDGGPALAPAWPLDRGARTAEPSRFSSSDSDFDDEEPRKFYVHIKPAPARAPACSPEAAAAQLRATAGSLILPPGPGVRLGRGVPGGAAGAG